MFRMQSASSLDSIVVLLYISVTIHLTIRHTLLVSGVQREQEGRRVDSIWPTSSLIRPGIEASASVAFGGSKTSRGWTRGGTILVGSCTSIIPRDRTQAYLKAYVKRKVGEVLHLPRMTC